MSTQKRIRAIRELGWHVEKTPGRLKLTRPDVAHPLFVPSTFLLPARLAEHAEHDAPHPAGRGGAVVKDDPPSIILRR